MEKIAAYPVQYETDVILKDGTKLFLRPVRIEDTEKCLALLKQVVDSADFIKLGHPTIGASSEDAVRFCTVDYLTTFAIVAEAVKEHKKVIVALGRYLTLPKKGSAEILVQVEEAYQRKGLGTIILEKLAAVARDNDLINFEADVLADSKPALFLLKNIGFHVASIKEGNIYHVIMPITPKSKMILKEQERERKATIESIRSFLYPKSIAIIGASRTPGTIGYSLIKCLQQSGYTGALYPVNAKTGVVQSIKAYPSVMDVPDAVDLAIIAVPAPAVAHVSEECGRKGVSSLIVISDGFKESGPEGAILERQLREIALTYGMRVVGPNCMGIINTDPSVNMNATFSVIYPSPGNISFLSQSGAMGVVVLEYARSLNTGINTFFSVGNRVDISANDLLQYWEQDQSTKVILLYLESFGNAQKFVRITRKVTAKKPVVVVKSGKSAAGSRAASSHTGSLATSEVVTEALFKQTGVIRVSAIEELFDVANLLSNQPLPRGRRLVIITNGGGPGILAADAAAEKGLILPEISPEIAAKIKPHLKRSVRVNNPLDTTPQVSTEDFTAIMEILASDMNNDAVLGIFIPPVIAEEDEIAVALRKVVPLFRKNNKLFLVCFLGQRGFKAELGTPGKYVPSYAFPENAISALAKAVEYAERRSQPKGSIPEIPGIKQDKANKLIENILSRSIQRPLWLAPDEIVELLDCYGIKFAASKLAKTAAEASVIASQMGFPVAVKLASATITHKTDVGGVVLNISSAPDVERAFNDIKTKLTHLGRVNEMDGVTVQPMVPEGIETIVGVSMDPSFGPLMMFGMGGVNAELMNDVAFRLHPLTDIDAWELINSIKMKKIFDGYRGVPASDTDALHGLLLRLSAMVEDLPEINELDFNPVKVLPYGQGYYVVDARISIS